MIDVSVIVVFRNEENYLVNCIQSIEDQFEQTSLKWELLLVDGMSSDRSVNLSEEYLKQKTFDWQMIENPKKILAAGWNLGIKAAKGLYVIRPDAHAALHKGYIVEGIKTLEDKADVTAVGGLLETKAHGFWGEIIKVALSSRVGVGNSSFRTAKESSYSDTAVYALYRRAIFLKAGYFNENLVRHQDNDMHQRIKEAGGKFYMNIAMKADYFARDSVEKLLAQMYQIGLYLPDIMINKSVSLRHLAPFGFYLVLFLGLFASYFITSIFAYLVMIQLGIYLSLILLDTLYKTISNKKPSLLFNIFIIPMMHINYAVGTFFGFIRITKNRLND
ncbi:MAG: glycosyltransferase [Bacteroidales bacterium]|nr:glycosyltransferase [Bacteroidales bacterium]